MKIFVKFSLSSHSASELRLELGIKVQSEYFLSQISGEKPC